MQQSKTKLSKELLGIDQALNRAATNAKLQAERLGTPYVVAQAKSNLEQQESERKIKQ
jgi:hypothetical protein